MWISEQKTEILCHVLAWNIKNLTLRVYLSLFCGEGEFDLFLQWHWADPYLLLHQTEILPCQASLGRRVEIIGVQKTNKKIPLLWGVWMPNEQWLLKGTWLTWEILPLITFTTSVHKRLWKRRVKCYFLLSGYSVLIDIGMVILLSHKINLVLPGLKACLFLFSLLMR